MKTKKQSSDYQFPDVHDFKAVEFMRSVRKDTDKLIRQHPEKFWARLIKTASKYKQHFRIRKKSA